MFAAMFRMSQAGVKIANTNMVVAELQKNWSLPTSADTCAACSKHVPNFGYISAHLEYASKKFWFETKTSAVYTT